jgi:hypothetical protein
MRSKHESLIDFLARQWEMSAACNSELVGCTEAEIAQIKSIQGVERLPASYEGFMKRMGRDMGGLEWHSGMELRYPYVLEFKAQSFERIREADVLVLSHNSDGDCALYCHVDDDDPIVYWMGYADDSLDHVIGEWGRFSDWLAELIDGAIGDAANSESTEKSL